MAQMIYVDREGAASDIMFHNASGQVLDYMKGNVKDYANTVGIYNPEMANRVMTRFEEINSSKHLAYVEILKNKLNNVWFVDSIVFLPSIFDIQNASNQMQRWIMANPHVRELYLNEAISGYNGEYVNQYPTGVAEKHYDYRRVTDGVVMRKDSQISHTRYIEKINQDDTLSIIHKGMILSTWDIMNAAIEAGDNTDFTTIWNSIV